MMPSVTFLQGDVLEQLATLPDESVHCCVTSPPYWGLRNYGVNGQIGLEKTPEEYVAKMVEVFREVRRVLRSDGVCFVNLGDSYAAGGERARGFDESRHQYTTNSPPPPQGRAPTPAGLKPKDLCGIPWRVAFALQAPDYLGRIRRESDRSWLAALVDGEGCISILETTSGRETGPVSTSYPPILQVRMCDRECIDKAMDLVGSSSDNPAQYPPSQGGVRPSYQWRIHGRKAADAIAEIYPFLLIKRKQAVVAWNHQAAREGYETKRGVRIPEAAMEKQKLCREIIQKLNQHESVDLPSWMVEPPKLYGFGWYLRQDVIWHKPNPMPESVTDRCTKAHEYIFLFSKNANYFYDAEAIKEPAQQASYDRYEYGFTTSQGKTGDNRNDASFSVKATRQKDGQERFRDLSGRNKRSVWTVPSQAYDGAHFATFPEDLIKPCILAGTSAKGCCPKCGAPWERVVEKGESMWEQRKSEGEPMRAGDFSRSSVNPKMSGARHNAWKMEHPDTTLGWNASCECGDAETIPCTVLDPFAGSFTTCAVSLDLGRNSIGIELNPQYVELGRARCAITPGLTC